ncbi:putative RNA-binding protein containing a PIN domain protein [Rubidibacter lacunae KORDI 51-2]|uniref:Putative RNA-binding protein containing a PIN domain protein n=1 Tax=Rubidibacter lacunae KORDI 51-2 TaxID=582515 RepID=U5DB41_9CHRO|nr:NYN domain-containing protein [Rubidibacter lacunae]ERN41763.1 putative RNA-binding protein containing a PIN domain protein [Rubidibacter lacunae KORDI 51-2]
MDTDFRRPLLLVDGYNIIGAWPELQRERDLEASRYRLIEELVDYSAACDLPTQIVFDAQMQRTPGCWETHGTLLAAYYTAYAQTADTYIEKVCASYARLPEYARKPLLVATSDRAQQLTVGGYGALWQSAKQLGQVVRHTQQQTRSHQKPRSTRGRSLFHSLDAAAQQRLEQMREGKREN